MCIRDSSQYLVNCADYLTYLPDALAVLGEDAYAGYLGDFLVGFSVMKERAYPAGLVVRKDIFDGLGYRTDDFSVTTEDYSSFDQITELFAKVKEAYPSMVCLDGTSIMGLQQYSYMDNMGSNFGVLENYGQSTVVTSWYESEQFKFFCTLGRESVSYTHLGRRQLYNSPGDVWPARTQWRRKNHIDENAHYTAGAERRLCHGMRSPRIAESAGQGNDRLSPPGVFHVPIHDRV